MSLLNASALNDYRIRPRNLTEYTAFRGVTDFTQIGQFDQYEGGYQFLSVISMPPYIMKCAEQDSSIADMVNSFKHAIEFEFRGLDGLPDMTSEQMTITDGINEQQLINKVRRDTSISVSSQYFEKRGGLFHAFSEYYLSGIKDPMTQAKTYHGLIKNNLMEPGPENEVFTLLYYATDNTMLRVEKAVLLANAQLTKAETSMYNGSRDNISNKEISIEFTCFPVIGTLVDKAAKKLLEDITGVNVTSNKGNVQYKVVNTDGVAALDSYDYKYGIFDASSPDKIQSLVDAVK